MKKPKQKANRIEKSLVAFDGNNILHRGYGAMSYSAKKQGQEFIPESAIKGFINIVLSDLAFVGATHCAVVFDRPGTNFRYKMYPEYKANREGGSDIDTLIPDCRRLLKAMGIRLAGVKGEEGDDVIGTIAYKAIDEDRDIVAHIASNDKDFAQLVTDRLLLLRPQRKVFGAEEVFDHYGVYPEQIIEYLMLLGDKVDNIPGVDKVGPKTASLILNTHGSIKKWLPTKKTPALQKNLDKVRKLFPMTRKLITIKTDCLPKFSVEKTLIQPYDKVELAAVCRDLGFKSTHKWIKSVLPKLPAYALHED